MASGEKSPLRKVMTRTNVTHYSDLDSDIARNDNTDQLPRKASIAVLNRPSTLSLGIITGLNLEDESFRFGMPLVFKVHCEELSGKGSLEINCTPADGADIKITPTVDESETYLCAITPQKIGDLEIVVKYGDKHIYGSPFQAQFGPAGDASKCHMMGTSEECLEQVDEDKLVFCISTEGAGEGLLTAVVRSISTKKFLPIELIQRDADHFNVEFGHSEGTEYALSIRYDEQHIQGSPFKILLPNASNCHAEGEGLTSARTEKWNKFVVDHPENAGPGELSVMVKGENETLEPTIVEKSATQFEVAYYPTKPGTYTISVLWSNEEISDSPFKVKCEKSVVDGSPAAGKQANVKYNADKCVVSKPAISGLNVKLQVDATEAGKAKLSAKAVGDTSGPVKVKVKESKHVFALSFTSPALDCYTLTVTWGDKPVPGSPFWLNLYPPNAREVTIAEPPSASLKAGQPIGVGFDTSKAGNGELTASCQAKEIGEVPVDVNKREKDRYYVQFTPPEEDIYTLNVLWADKHIKGSPFLINLIPVNVDKIEAIGPRQLNDREGPVLLTLYTEDAGGGQVTANCMGETAGKVRVAITEKSKDCYEVSFQPPQADIYKFAVQYGGRSINRSPFHINTLPPDASKVIVTEPQKVELAQPVHYKCDVKDAGAGNLSASCVGKKYGAIELDIVEEITNNLYDLSFTPRHPDIYILTIYWGGQGVPRSPFKNNLLPPDPDRVKVKAVHFPDEAGSGEEAFVDLDCSNTGEAAVTAEVKGDHVGEIPAEVESPEEDHYRVKFLPQQADFYHLSVYYGGNHVPGSPFSRNLIPPQPDCVELTNTSIPEEAGAPIALTFDTKDAGRGTLTAKATGDSTGPIPVDVDQTSPTTFNVSFIPPKPDDYKVDVFWADEPVKGSPFTIDTRPPIFPENVKCGEPSFDGTKRPVVLPVDTTTAGKGTLTAKCVGCEKWNDIPVNLVETSDKKIYNISFKPPREEVYSLFIYYEGTEVSGSPFLIDIRPKEQVNEMTQMNPLQAAEETIFIPEEFQEEEGEGGGKDDSPPADLTNYIGEPTTLTVDAEDEDQRKGELKAVATGDKTGPADIKVSQNPNGSFDVYFNPDKPDRYKIDVTLSGEHIPSCPFYINYIFRVDPTKCLITGLEELQPVLPLNERAQFGVDTRRAGDGKLLVTVDGPSGSEGTSKVEVRGAEEDPYLYTIAYTPTAAGIHRLHLYWAGEAIPGSPVVLRVGEAGEMKTYAHGEPVMMEIYSNSQIEELECYAIHEDTDGRYEVTISEAQEGKFKLSFQPKEPGIYAIHVHLKGKEIPGSPYRIRYAFPPNPDACLVRDLSDKGYVGEPLKFTVDATDAGSGDLHVKATGPSGSKKAEITVTDNKNGTYSVKYTPNIHGDHHIHITWAGVPIPGSPFKVLIMPDTSRVCILEADKHVFEEAQPSDAPARFQVSVTGAGPGMLNIVSSGPGKVKTRVYDSENGIYTCQITPKVAGRYFIDILWNRERIVGSPCVLRFQSAKRSYRITGLDLEDAKFHVGVPHKFKVYCPRKQVGALEMVGILEIKCKPPQAAQIRLIPIVDSNSYQCEIIPQEVGNHQVSVQYNGKHILSSPFNVVFESDDSASKCHIVESTIDEKGDQVTFLVSTEGDVEMSASAENVTTKEQCPVTINSDPDNHYNVQFSIQQGTEYLVAIMCNEHHIQGSPLKLAFPKPSSVSQCHAAGKGLFAAQVGKPNKFTVYKDSAGIGELTVEIEKGDEILEPTITPVSLSQYDVSYQPTEPGTYKIFVRCREDNIAESPFEVRCYPPADTPRLSIPEPASEVFIEAPLEFAVKADSVSEEGELTVVLQSSTNKYFPGVTRKEEDGNYTCSVRPPDVGKYMVHVNWNGQDIQGSPFKVKAMSPPRPENVKAYGPGLDDGFVGREGNFTVETAEGGTGTLAVRVHGPKGAFKINMRRHPDTERTIMVRYDPKYVGTYTVDITWSEEHIPGSPFSVNIAERQEEGDKETDSEKDDEEVHIC